MNIRELVAKKILLLDGATGTQIQSFDPSAEDFGGEQYNGCNDYLNITRPEMIKEIHRRYLRAGSDIISTNSFGAIPNVLEEYDLKDKTYEIAKLSAQIAKETVTEFNSEIKPRFIAGSIGPTNKLINISPDITFDEMKANYRVAIEGLLDGGADIILFETCPDTSNLKAGAKALKELEEERNIEIPLMISVTIERNGTMLSGQDIEALYYSVAHLNPLSIGINCGLGPAQVQEHIKTLSKVANCATSLHPNAGLPDENGEYTESPEVFSNTVKNILQNGYANIAGGCCGTTPEHIAALSDKITDIPPRKPSGLSPSISTGIDLLEFSEDNRPVFVGERTNMSGSKKFRKLIREEKFDAASDVAKKQVMKGAQVIDINLADTETEEQDNISRFYPVVLKKIKTPIMIDSTASADVIETALKFLQGKAIINSVNFEDMNRFDEVASLVSKYGAMIMTLLIDEKEMAVTLEHKIELADRMYNRLTDLGIKPADIIFDCLVFPVGSGDSSYYQCAKNTIDSIKAIKTKYPDTKFSLGISNCSFGLPAAGREALNSAYIYYATKAGLDMAIVNSEKVVRYATLTEEEKTLCYNILFDNSDDNVNAFVNFYSEKKVRAKQDDEHLKLPLEERIKYYIIEGLKTGLTEDLDEARKSTAPMDIINSTLMEGMAEVGRRFNANELTVIEVLQSAEVMKSAVDHLKQFLDKNDVTTKGKFILATVKGDVHDIGKNLVEIVLSNNGYEVIDLGIKVDSSTIIEAIKEHNPDAVGLSGLLVKSALQMVTTAQDIREAGIDIPIYIGGAALSEKFATQKIQPHYDGEIIYSKDAINCLNQLDNRFTSRVKEGVVNDQVPSAVSRPVKSDQNSDDLPLPDLKEVSKLPVPTDFDTHLFESPDLEELFANINPNMLYGKHFGLKGGGYRKLIAENDPKAIELTKKVKEVQTEIIEKQLFKPKGVFRFFRATKEKETLIVLDENSKILERFPFPRQYKGENLCLTDYISNNKTDIIGFFSVTAGEGIHELAGKYKNEGEFVKSHILFSLAIETAEAFAEIIHRDMRSFIGINDPADFTPEDLFKVKYQGCRYSFGYPACPDLNLQEPLFKLLEITENIGVKLTEGMMMEPEASITAMVMHHPEAKYFSV